MKREFLRQCEASVSPLAIEACFDGGIHTDGAALERR